MQGHADSWYAASANPAPAHPGLEGEVGVEGRAGRFLLDPLSLLILLLASLCAVKLVKPDADFDVWQTSLHNPDFAAFAELCGAKGYRVTSMDELDDAIAAALAYDGPALVDVVTDALLI